MMLQRVKQCKDVQNGMSYGSARETNAYYV
jgi:hypothetical protein